MWDLCTHMDNMLETVLSYVVYMYTYSLLKNILRSDILHLSAILPEKGKLFIIHIFKQVHFEMMNPSVFFYVCVHTHEFVELRG